jgi:phage N-6-adenine-methyltransferase
MNKPHNIRVTERDDYCTPDNLFKKLDAVFNFNLDVAASRSNAKCQFYHTINDSALECEWGGRVWCNPPFSQKEAFLKQAIASRNSAEVICVLVPNSARESKWFREYAMQATEIINLYPRVNYCLDGEERKGVSFGSCLLVYYPELAPGQPREIYFKWK